MWFVLGNNLGRSHSPDKTKSSIDDYRAVVCLDNSELTQTEINYVKTVGLGVGRICVWILTCTPSPEYLLLGRSCTSCLCVCPSTSLCFSLRTFWFFAVCQHRLCLSCAELFCSTIIHKYVFVFSGLYFQSLLEVSSLLKTLFKRYCFPPRFSKKYRRLGFRY